MKWVTRLLGGMTAFLVLLIVAALAAPWLFKDRLLAEIRTQANQNLNARVDLKDIELSLLTSFPQLSVRIDALSVVGPPPFDDKPLLEADAIEVGVDTWQLITTRQVFIHRINVERPQVDVRVDEKGRANYNIFKPAPETASSTASSTRLEIDAYAIANGNVTYSAPGMKVMIQELNHKGRALLEGVTQVLASNTNIGALTVETPTLRMLDEAQLAVDLDLTVDGQKQQAQLRTGDVKLNALGMAANGTVGWGGTAPSVDLTIQSKDAMSVKSLVSMLPKEYTKDFAQLNADGRFSLKAAVKGPVESKPGHIPAVTASLLLEDGRVQFPKRKLPIEDLQLDVTIEHPGGDYDRAKVRVKTAHLRIDKSEVDAKFVGTRLRTTQSLQGDIKASIDLADVDQSLPVDAGPHMAGKLQAAVDLVSNGADIRRLSGMLEAQDVQVPSADGPPWNLPQIKLQLTPQQTKIEAVRLLRGQSDVTLSGSISPLPTLLSDRPIEGQLSIKSKLLKASDFTSEPPADAPPPSPNGFAFPEKLQATVTFDIDKLQSANLQLTNVTGTAEVKDQVLTVKKMQARGLGGSMEASGKVVTSAKETPKFDFSYKLQKASFKDTFSAVGFVQSLAPIAERLTGRYGTEIKLAGRLTEDLSLKTEALDLDGFLASEASQLTDFKPLNALAKVVPRIDSPLSIDAAKAFFTVADGKVRVKEFPLKTGGLQMKVAGEHGLDQQMRYTLAFDLPAKEVQATSLVNKLKSVAPGIANLTKVQLKAIVTGSVGSPQVSFDVSVPQASELVKQKVDAVKQKAVDKLSAAAQRLLDSAKARAAKIREEAATAAKKVEDKGDREASKLQANAKGNPLLKLGADRAAAEIRKKSEAAAAKIISSAEEQAQKVIADAEEKARSL